MSSILEEGFLATDIQHWIRENESQKPELLLARDVNRLAQAIFISSSPQGDRGLLVAALFARMLEHYQATVLMAERNMENSATAMTRILLEPAFSLVACVKHEDFHYKLADWDALTVKKMAKSLQKVSPQGSTLTQTELDAIAKQIEEAQRDLDTLYKQNKEAALTDDNDLKASRIAEYAGMEDFYHAIYSVFSNTVHSAVRSLGGHVEVDAEGGIKNIAWGPDQLQGYALSTAIAVMLHSMEAYVALHPSDAFVSALQPLLERLRVMEEEAMHALGSSSSVEVKPAPSP